MRDLEVFKDSFNKGTLEEKTLEDTMKAVGTLRSNKKKYLEDINNRLKIINSNDQNNIN